MAEEKAARASRNGKRRHWREADARAELEAWRRSGKRLTEYARERGVRPQRLSRWAARLKARAGQADVPFHPVKLVTPRSVPAQPKEVLEVVLRDGRLVRVPYGFAPEHLHGVLQVLEGETGC